MYEAFLPAQEENGEGRLVVTRDYTPHALLLLRRKKRHLAGLSYRSPGQIRRADASGTSPILRKHRTRWA